MIMNSNISSSEMGNPGTIPSSVVYPANEWILYKVIWPCLIAFGCLSNASFMWTFVKSISLRTACYTYLVSLSCADLVNLIVFAISLAYAQTLMRFHENLDKTFVDKILHFFHIWSFLCSVDLVSLVTAERFLAICHPLKHRFLKGTRRTIRLISLVCVLSFLEAFTSMPFNSEVYSSEDSGNILYKKIAISFYIFIWICFAVFNFRMYYRIISALNKRMRNRSMENVSNNIEIQNRQVSVMLVTNGTLYFVLLSVAMVGRILALCWLLRLEVLSPYQMYLWFNVQQLCVCLNASINPLVYTVTNARYREEQKKALSKLFSIG